MKTSIIFFIAGAICLTIAFIVGKDNYGIVFIGLMNYFIGLGIGYMNNEKKIALMQSLIDKQKDLCDSLQKFYNAYVARQSS